jgi:hypothetical protein
VEKRRSLDDDDEEDNDDNPGYYLNELLAVADARFELEQYVKAGDIYYGPYYAAMHNATHTNNPPAFLIAHKMIHVWVKSDDDNYLN